MSSWDEAVQQFPSHTSASVLESFCHLSFQKSIPQSFISFCQSALQKESITESDENDHLIGLAAFYAWVRAKHFGCHSVVLSVCLSVSHNGNSLSGLQT